MPADKVDRVDRTTPSARRITAWCAAAIVVVTAAVATAIGADPGPSDRWVAPAPDGATVTYDLYDGETEPSLERSYRLTLSQGEARLEVFSESLVLFDETYDLPDDVWRRTLDAANSLHGAVSTPRDGCVDADGSQLTVFNRRNAVVVRVFVDGCTGGEVPDLASVVEEVKGLIDVDERVAAIDYFATVGSGD